MAKVFFILFIFSVIISCNHTEEPTPVISSLSVALGSQGKQVTISGLLFSSVASENIVKFNGTLAEVTSATQTQLDVTVPAGATSGKVTVTVKGQTATGPEFTIYTPGSLTNLSPVCGPENTEITIEGNGFETNMANMQVIFNYSYIVETSPNSYTGVSGKAGLTIKSLSTTQIKVLAPSGIPEESSGELIITAFGSEQLYIQGTNQANLKFAMQPFTISNFAPKVGKAGTLVTFTGTGFVNDLDMYNVFFMDGPSHIIKATITNITSTQLTVEVPEGVITGETSMFYDRRDGKPHSGAAFPGVFTVQQ